MKHKEIILFTSVWSSACTAD